MLNKFLVILLIASSILIGLLYFLLTRNTSNTEVGVAENINCIPTFADGGGPYYQLNSPFREKIVPDSNNGDKLVVKGRVLQSDCKTPIANAVLDIWQANESGNYEDVWYRGRVMTDDNGTYRFETVIPKGYGEGSGFRPPHIHFKVWQNDKELITSQMFFPESKGKPGFEDAYIMKVEEKGNNTFEGYHDIILP